MRTAYRRRDRHSIVIENNEHARRKNFQAVERLIDKPVIKRAVSDKRDHVKRLFFQIARLRNTKRS